MAKIKFGMMMTDARGKLGGQVFSKNRAGAYIRTKVSPVNPQTASQSKVRSNLASMSTEWNLLSIDEINRWNSAVDDWATTDIFGDIKKPTGKNLFVKLNLNLLNSGQTAIAQPPSKMFLPELTGVTAEIDITAHTASLEGLPVLTDGKYQIEACPPVAIGVSFVKNKFRVISYVSQTTAGSVDVKGAYIAKFGTFVNAENIFFRIRAIGENGQAGVPLIVRANFS